MKRVPTIIVTILLVITAGAIVQGRVFSRWKGSSDVVGNLTRLGGSVAYSSQIRLNGGEGQLTVVGFDDALDTINSKIRQIFELPITDIRQGSSSSLHIIRGASTTCRLVLLRLEHTSRVLAIAIEQTHADFLKSKAPPQNNLIKALPPFPGSIPTFFAEDINTKLRVAVGTTTASSEVVRQFYARDLHAKGWTASLSDAQGSTTKMPLYHRVNEICCVLVTPTENPQTQQITVLHKELGNTTK